MERTAKRDLARLSRRMPWLQQFSELSLQGQKELGKYYEAYQRYASKEQMPISWNLALFLFAFCCSERPKRILDLGSGFSSVLFRLHQRNHDPQCSVTSVDDSPVWLEITRNVLVSHSLSDEKLLLWSKFSQQNKGTFDLVLHDLGDQTVRTDTLSQAISFAGAYGSIVADDVQWLDYQVFMRRRTNRKCYSLRSVTLDRWGRYAVLL